MHLNNPLMVGFGISNKATFQAACEHASGAIIGSQVRHSARRRKRPGKSYSEIKRSIEVSTTDSNPAISN